MHPIIRRHEAKRADGKLRRRTIACKVAISGDVTASLKKSARADLKKRPHAQQIIYTHSRTKVETTLRQSADVLLEENQEKNGGPNSVSHLFIGSDGVMMKNVTMIAIKNYETLDGKGTL